MRGQSHGAGSTHSGDWAGCVLVLAIFGGGWLVGRLGIGSVVNPASLTEVERQFTERMRDVALVGTFLTRLTDAI